MPGYSVISLIKSDLKAKAAWVYGSDSKKEIIKTLVSDGTCAMLLYRLMQASRKAGLSPLAMVFNKLIIWLGGCVIGRGAEFGPGFVLIHSLGIVINSGVVGGSQIYLEHQVTIGAEKHQAPVLGNKVFVGAGAKIVGPVRLGDNVKVGANAVVVHDMPDNVTCVGIPAKVVKNIDTEM
jgi:serine O-acetyltransferase